MGLKAKIVQQSLTLNLKSLVSRSIRNWSKQPKIRRPLYQLLPTLLLYEFLTILPSYWTLHLYVLPIQKLISTILLLLVARHPKSVNHLYVQYLYRHRTASLLTKVCDLEFKFPELNHHVRAALLIITLPKSFSYYISMLLNNESNRLFPPTR